MKRYILFLLTTMISFGVFAQPSTKKVGIYITGEINANYKKVIVSKMISQITQTDGFVAVERTNEFLSALSREQDYQLSGAVSDNDIARLGAQFGVHYVLVADLSELFEEVFVSARAINVETAQIIAATETNSKVDSMQSLTDLANNISKDFIGALKYSGMFAQIKIGKVTDITQLDELPANLINDPDLIDYFVSTHRNNTRQYTSSSVDIPVIMEVVYRRDEDMRGAYPNSSYSPITRSTYKVIAWSYGVDDYYFLWDWTIYKGRKTDMSDLTGEYHDPLGGYGRSVYYYLYFD